MNNDMRTRRAEMIEAIYSDDDFDDDSLTIRNCVFGFKCDKNWGELTHTESGGVRFCQSCQKEVFFCESDDELVKYVRLNRCVAMYKEEGFGNMTTMGYININPASD